MKKEKILDTILKAFDNENFIKIEGYDDSIIGIDLKSMRLIYSTSKIINTLKQKMSEIEAIEFYELKIVPEQIGDLTPILCEDYF